MIFSVGLARPYTNPTQDMIQEMGPFFAIFCSFWLDFLEYFLFFLVILVKSRENTRRRKEV